MTLLEWLEGVAVVAFALVPFVLIWACTMLWLRHRSNWTLAAMIGAMSGVVGAVAVWIDFFIHYSSVETMMAQNADPLLEWQLVMKLSLSIGFLVATGALVGYARSLPK